jgi:hypothetical protein
MALLGRTASIKLDAGVNTVVDLYNWSITIESPPIEQPVFGDTWAKTHALGINSWSGSFEGIFSTVDTNGQVALRNAQLNSTVVSGIRFYLDTGNYYQGDAYITTQDVSTDPEDVSRITYNFTGTGALTLTTA